LCQSRGNEIRYLGSPMLAARIIKNFESSLPFVQMIQLGHLGVPLRGLREDRHSTVKPAYFSQPLFHSSENRRPIRWNFGSQNGQGQREKFAQNSWNETDRMESL
jgi:hypothetical protein